MPRVGLSSHNLFKILMAKNEKDWFKLKRYPHIGLPLKNEDRQKWIEKYITSPELISKHSFLPFIHKTSKVRKFRRDYDENGIAKFRIVNGKKQYRLKHPEKKRELYYASHLDSLIYSYYAQQISKKYEEKLIDKKLGEVINAYRSIPLHSNTGSPNKCNIDFANDIFKNILSYNEDSFVVIAFDIKSFFDNLNHQKLREIWMDVLGVEKLPPDHFNVYKNITRFSYVDIVDLFEEFKDKIYIQKKTKDGKLLPLKNKKVSQIKFLRNQEAVAFCTKQEFLKKKNKLLKNYKQVKGSTDTRNFGIPQGSPISALLANMYLINFDEVINNYVLLNGGKYKRYSDDMVVICRTDEKENIIKLINSTITNFNLVIQESKTQIFHFKKEKNRLVCGQEFSSINWNKNFIYLGFEFDGQTVLLKSGSISGYYRKMNRAVARAKRQSQNIFNKRKGEIFKRRILKKFSQKGATRRRKWLWNSKVAGFVKTEHYDWGNFLSYAYKASEVMVRNKIKGQTLKHWNKLNKLLKK